RIKKNWPEFSVVASHQITREWREYERSTTTALAAYVLPKTKQYLNKLSSALKQNDFSGRAYAMQSNGGIDSFEAAGSRAITMVESGPASGVLGAEMLGRQLELGSMITLDIGGTTAKCSLLQNGKVQITTDYAIERTRQYSGYPIMAPTVDLVEIGNGGGSIAWIDDDGQLHVGPKSAGASPGPIAYGLGGTEPTTTDANLILGRIDADYFCGGQRSADMGSIQKGFLDLGKKIGMNAKETARGVIRVANNNMVNALKLVSVNRGFDPRDFTLVAFGGGGGMHAMFLAKELQIAKVIVPARSAVFSAWGMLMSDIRRDYLLTRPVLIGEEFFNDIIQIYKTLEEQALEELTGEGLAANDITFERYGDMRYHGQEFTIKIPFSSDKLNKQSIAELAELFSQNYEREYTYRLPNAVELVSFHVVARGDLGSPQSEKKNRKHGSLTEAIRGHRQVDFDELGVHETVIYERDLIAAGLKIEGPAIIEESTSTIVVLPGSYATVDDYGHLHLNLND
ncbi:MAG: hydantoinase/oxoprolinase family protein, partial [Gammaproteobacteria bacterium]|nr:hydantoinase/oxoprolinase family protein [Gammaproteobacteria bacterium]